MTIMAYVQFEQMPDASAAGAVRHPRAEFGAIEREVLRLSYGDTRSSLGVPGRFARIGGWLAGRRAKPGLADRRLEALRRYAVLYRLDGEALDPAEDIAIAAAGFDRHALRDVQLLVDRHLASRSHNAASRFRSVLTFLGGTVVLGAVALLLQQATDDLAVSAIVSGILGATAASLHHPAARA
ncbi:hypothetical protein [Sphingomonas lycopersici]|nr:hypothetical protein [Sphingomonas lycopersici]